MDIKTVLVLLVTNLFATRIEARSFEGENERNWKSDGAISNIVNGQDSPMRKFYVHVTVLDALLSEKSCGGAIVDSEWVVTAAQCVLGSASSRVIVQTSDFVVFGALGDIKRVTRIILHEGFGFIDGSPVNDIALLKIDNSFHSTDPLPLCEQVEGECAMLGTCGLGSINEHFNHVPGFLQEAIFQPTDTRFFFRCPRENVCVKNGASKMAMGDTGSPLYVLFPGTHSPECLYGVYSYGERLIGASDLMEYRFASIPHFADWIRMTMEAN